MISRTTYRIESQQFPLAFFSSFPPPRFTVLPLLRHDIFLVYLSHQLSLCLILCSRGWMVSMSNVVYIQIYCTTFRSLGFSSHLQTTFCARKRRFPIESSQRCPFSSIKRSLLFCGKPSLSIVARPKSTVDAPSSCNAISFCNSFVLVVHRILCMTLRRTRVTDGQIDGRTDVQTLLCGCLNAF